MDIGKGRLTSMLTFLLSILALFASIEGIFNKNLYYELLMAGRLSKSLMIASVAQDIISAPLAVVLAVLSIMFWIRPQLKNMIVIIGLAWYFFYAFGLYVIQGHYTSIYLIYLAIFGLSIYSMIWGMLSLKMDVVKYYQLPRLLVNFIGGFLIFILLLLVPAWLFRMAPNIARHIPGETYSVFIMDLCIVFPAFGQIAYRLFRKQPFGVIMAGIALTKTMTLCLSWAFSHWFSPMYGGVEFESGLTFISTLLTLVSLALFIPYMLKIKKEEALV
ncbi:MAG TPA: hypothetical protein VEC37_02575 [Bacillota bacterium]|nr:hypothetical protein [Bacillota bacterium]